MRPIRLAGEEALLRANLNAMFVNLSRRSQTLVERQLDIIDVLEQSEQDADRLSSLFRLDHLATRMRRNSENLLVLAGHEASRKWTEAVPLVDVLRASISEIEEYERISLNVQPGVAIVGRAANDVVHLVAELLENAAAFSSEDTQVAVVSQLLSSGGALIEITDEGLGIAAEELVYANWRLDNPPVIDVSVSRRMGLFVVGRLAARHGIRVRLRKLPRGGLSALIWVPDSIAAFESAAPLAGLRRRPESRARSFHPFFRPGRRATPAPAVAVAAAAVAVAAAPASPQDQLAELTGPAHTTQSGLPVRSARPSPQAQPAQSADHGDQALAAAPPPTPGSRLPIYDAVESDWFQYSGKAILPTGSGRPPRGHRRPTRASALLRQPSHRRRARPPRPGCRSECRTRTSSPARLAACPATRPVAPTVTHPVGRKPASSPGPPVPERPLPGRGSARQHPSARPGGQSRCAVGSLTCSEEHAAAARTHRGTSGPMKANHRHGKERP